MATFNRGLLKSMLAAGPVNLLTGADSIMQPFNTAYSIAEELNMRWPIACLGSRQGIVNAGQTNWPTFTTQWAGGTSGTARLIRPGDVSTDSDSGANVMTTNFCEAGVDMSNFGSPIQINVQPAGTNIPNWDTNRNVEIILTGRTDPVAANPDLWRIEYLDRAGTLINQLSPVDFDQPRADRFWKTPVFAAGSGASNTRGRLSTWNETETGALIKTCTAGVRVVGASSGIFWGYTGQGSSGIRNWSTQAGAVITADPPTYTCRVDDSALINDFAAYGWDYMLLLIGANDAALNKADFKAELMLKIARYRACRAAAGLLGTLRFGLMSQYDLNDANTLQVEKAEAMEEIAKADGNVEFFDVRLHVFNTLGINSNWRAAQTPDGVHPTGALLRQTIADGLWAMINGPVHAQFGTPTLGLRIGIGL